MNLNPRHTALLDEVRAHGPQTIEALSERFGVTLQTVRRDVMQGKVTIEHARSAYGVAIDAKSFAVDDAATQRARASTAQTR